MNNISVPSQRYEDSRHLLQNPKVPRSVMGFRNRAQRFTGSNYLDVDSPLKRKLTNIVFNKSSIVLTQEMEDLLNRGLNCSVLPNRLDFNTFITLPFRIPFQIIRCLNLRRNSSIQLLD